MRLSLRRLPWAGTLGRWRVEAWPPRPLEAPHLGLEALHQDGHQQVEEHVVAEGHEGNEVEGGPRGGGGHAVVEDDVPVLLGEDLSGEGRQQLSL